MHPPPTPRTSPASFPQRIRNALACEVYEAHGRAALEYGDLAEFNQCQTQLHAMYADKVPGCVAEFTAYKVRGRVKGKGGRVKGKGGRVKGKGGREGERRQEG